MLMISDSPDRQTDGQTVEKDRERDCPDRQKDSQANGSVGFSLVGGGMSSVQICQYSILFLDAV